MTKKDNAKQLSRREFIGNSGVFLAGAALGAVSLGMSDSKTAKPEATKPDTPPAFPWPYTQLDSVYARRYAHYGHRLGNCSSGSFFAILSMLRDKIGYPFTTLNLEPPNNMMHFGSGGVVGWGSLCGALIGTFAAINLVSPRANEIINELMAWYIKAPLPSGKSVDYWQKGEFNHDGFLDIEIPVSVAKSTLCHVSVSEWCKVSGFKNRSVQRKERCYRITADVVYYAVQLLNKSLIENNDLITHTPPDSVESCMTCHGPAKLDDTRGKEDCLLCHKGH